MRRLRPAVITASDIKSGIIAVKKSQDAPAQNLEVLASNTIRRELIEPGVCIRMVNLIMSGMLLAVQLIFNRNDRNNQNNLSLSDFTMLPDR